MPQGGSAPRGPDTAVPKRRRMAQDLTQEELESDVVRRLGAGRFGEVFRVWREADQKHYAVKAILKQPFRPGH